MMRSRQTLCSTRLPFVVLALALGIPASAQDSVYLRSLGLEPAWSTSIQVPYDGGGVASAEMWLDQNSKRAYAVVELPTTTVQIPFDQLDQNFQPLGKENAMAMAREQAAKILGKTDGFEVIERSIGQLRLVVTMHDGLVQCLDAETGKLLWATPCGATTTPTYSAALSQAGVAVVQGDSLYLLDWAGGREVLRKKLPTGTTSSLGTVDTNETGARPSRGDAPETTGQEAAVNSLAFTIDFTGLVNGYSFSHPIAPWKYRVIGRTIGTPVSLPNRSSVAVATEAGWLYVFSGTRTPKVLFRYESGSQFDGGVAAGMDAFYAGDLSGTLSKISMANRGSLAWTHRLQHGVTAPPLVDSEHGLVYVSTTAGNLTAIDDSSGLAAWHEDATRGVRVRAPIAVTGDRLICRSFDQSIAAFDLRNGQPLAQTPPMTLSDTMIVNPLTDRLYFFGPKGQLHCYRPIGKSLPKISPAFDGSVVPKDKSAESNYPLSNEPSMEDVEQPFEETDSMGDDLDSDPFGGETEEDDPFGS